MNISDWISKIDEEHGAALIANDIDSPEMQARFLAMEAAGNTVRFLQNEKQNMVIARNWFTRLAWGITYKTIYYLQR